MHIVDFLLVLIELFSLGVKAEELWAKIDWKLAFLQEWGSVWPKIAQTTSNDSFC